MAAIILVVVVVVVVQVYQGKVHLTLLQVAEKEEECHRQVLWHSLRVWRENVREVKVAERNEERARCHWKQHTLHKTTVLWRQAAILGLHRREEKAETVAKARRCLDSVTLRTAFLRWWTLAVASRREKGLIAAATQHCARQRLREALNRWKRYHHHCLRKQVHKTMIPSCVRQGKKMLMAFALLLSQLLQKRAERSRAWSLLTAALSTWKQQRALRREEALQTARALWLWSCSLRGKALRAWAQWAKERQRKAARLRMATQAHRNLLVQDGALRLLRYTSRKKEARAQSQAQNEAEAAVLRRHAVERCFSLWKRKVLHRRGNAPPKRVTFGEKEEQDGSRGAPSAVLGRRKRPRRSHDEDRLRAELGSIGQWMRQYHESQQELQSLRRRIRLLRKWQEVRAEGEEEQSGDSREVEGAVNQLTLQARSLEARLAEEKGKMATSISRLQEIRKALYTVDGK
nr:PREDICTED: protein SFI1 homolog isoform X1 [Anolis carolinensis]|eukprot:XP_003219076.2 PREDICTED: protein SFI1 homolog isoform X1 [Anolis carolinensis]